MTQTMQRTPSQILTRLATAQSAGAVDEVDRTIQFVFSNPGAVRGDNHQLVRGAWVGNWKGMSRTGLTNFKRNPIVIEGHRYDGRGVAKVISIDELPDGRLVGTVQFADTEDGRELFELYRTGIQSACSIGWAAAEATQSTDPTRGYGALDIQRAELMEISLVPVGADENALVMGRSAKRASAPKVYPMPRAPGGPFKNFSEQLSAIVSSRASGVVDQRLVRAPTGAGELDPSGGGFLVGTEFAQELVRSIFAESVLAQRVDARTTTGQIADVRIPAVDETSRKDGSRSGGAISYFPQEGSTIPASMPKFRSLQFSAKKVAALTYLTSELLNDGDFAQNALKRVLADELAFAIDRAIFAGSGAGTPLGIINAPCKVTVAKESGQAAASIVYENIVKMYSRMPASLRRGAVWLINQDIEPQLYALSQAVGVNSIPVYMPANQPMSTVGFLLGRPVIPIEQASTLGTEGDIVLASLPDYVMVTNDPSVAISADVSFVNDQAVLRMTQRLDGMMRYSSPLTAYNGASTLSPVITLATRA